MQTLPANLTPEDSKSLQMGLNYKLKSILENCITKNVSPVISLNETLESDDDFFRLFASKLIEVRQELPNLGLNEQSAVVSEKLNQDYIFGRDQIQTALDEVNDRPMPKTINLGIHLHFNEK